MSVASGAAHVPQHNSDRRLRVARLHPQIDIGKAVAAIARDDHPRMPGRNRRADLWPEPHRALRREFRIETPHGRKRIALGRPCALHPLDRLYPLVMMGPAVTFGHGEQ